MSNFSTAAYIALSLVAALAASSDARAQGSATDSIAQNDEIARLDPFFSKSISTLAFTEIEKQTMNSDLRSRLRISVPTSNQRFDPAPADVGSLGRS
jgi:hypothetical protein